MAQSILIKTKMNVILTIRKTDETLRWLIDRF